ncbi:MAG TPA: YidB family protein [Pseudolabrys sp.]|nr:YidB family protein [Pseudolabrys sp.]
MGLMDVLNGMQNGPHGQQGQNSSGGGMSPITMAVLGLLAYKAIKHFTSEPAANPAAPGAATAPNQNTGGGGFGGLLNSGLGGLFSGQSAGGSGGLLGSLGGLLGGAAAGNVISGGLSDLLNQLHQSGQGDIANSWVGHGDNKAIAPNDLASALGEEKINTLTAQTGLSRDELLAGLSQHLPEVVNQLTPQGRVPTEQEVSI